MVVQQWFGVVALGVGALFAYHALKTYRIAKRRHRFEPITATVVDSELEERTRRSGQEIPKHSTKYMPHIEWEYTVDGETYTDNKRFGGSGNKEDEQEVVDEYPEGETVEVQYDPADPSVSFLENVPKKEGAMLSGAIGGILLLFGLGLLVFTPF